MPLRQDLHVRQGETFAFTYTHLDSAGSAVDLTGYSARMAVRVNYGDDEEVYFSTGDDAAGGSIALGGSEGTVSLSMTAAQAKAVAGDLLRYVFGKPVGTPLRQREVFRYDLELEAPDGTVTRALEGAFIVHREVTT